MQQAESTTPERFLLSLSHLGLSAVALVVLVLGAASKSPTLLLLLAAVLAKVEVCRALADGCM